MHSIRIHGMTNKLISFYYRMGIWHRGDVPTVREIRVKAFYCFYYLLLFISFLVGAITSENIDESIFLTEAAVMAAVLSVKFWILIRKQNEILDLLNRICVFSIRDDEDFDFFNNKLGKFIKFVVAFLCSSTFFCFCASVVEPFVGSERKFMADIAFPLDYRKNEIAFWIAHIFQISEISLSVVASSSSTVIWYLMFHCSLRYEVLGREIRKTGRITENGKKKMLEKEKHTIFFQDLTMSIDAHCHLRGLIGEVASFTSDIFFIQFATSGICICGSICCLAFNVSESYIEQSYHMYSLFYNISELFVITYFGNEIMLSSGRLTYSLFESDWIEQPQSTKKCIIIFGEYLKKPHELMIGKVYPLTLETFTRILRSAYSMFNILKSTKK